MMSIGYVKSTGLCIKTLVDLSQPQETVFVMEHKVCVEYRHLEVCAGPIPLELTREKFCASFVIEYPGF